MSNRFVIYADITKRQLCSQEGNNASLPQLTFGDNVTFAVRLLDRDADGVRLTDLKLRNLRAAIGPVMQCPVAGRFSLRFGTGTESVMLPITATCDALREAIVALPEEATYPLLDVLPGVDKGVWLLRFDHEGEVPLAVCTNQLFPRAFVRVRVFQTNNRWWHEVRLIVAPYSFVNQFYRVLSPAPSVTRIRAGDPGDNETPAQNEVQKIHVPSTFAGTYYVTFDYRTSRLLGTTDGPDEVASALNAMWSDGATRFVATLPESNEVYVEFVGLLGKFPQNMMAITVNTFRAGDISFDLDLNTADLASALRASASVTVPLEVELDVVGDDENPDDPNIPGKVMTLFSAPLTIVREQIWAELATVPAINWIRPPQPKDYVPYGQNQVITGAQNYIACIGDGTAKNIVLDHNLGTEALHITVRENASGGHRIPDNAYDVVFTDENSLTLVFATAPAANALAVTISTAGPRSAFVSGLRVTEAQVDGLLDDLRVLGGRVGAIEDLLPSVSPTRADSSSAGGTIAVPGGLGRRGSHLEAGGYIGSDGRVWYRLSRDGATNSFYPTDFERELFMLHVNDHMLRAGHAFTLDFKLTLQLFKATTRTQYLLVIEAGSAPGQDSPAPVGQNLADVTWLDTPLLTQRIIVTPLKVTGAFGCAVRRDALGALAADQMSYNNWTGADAIPVSANFTLRARLKEFDTENSVVGAKGLLYYALSNAKAEIS